MTTWLRRLRGAVGLGLAWAFVWFAAGMALLLVVGPDAADVPFPLFFGLLGFLGGMAFSGILRLTEGRRRFDQMSLPRFAGWGGLGGAVLATGLSLVAGWDAYAILAPLFAAAGAGCAAGTLAVARMAEEPGASALEEELDGIGLTEAEARELLDGG